MDGGNSLQNARNLKVFSLLFLALLGASLVLVHNDSYEPAVTFLLLYLVASAGGILSAMVVPLWPAERFTGRFSAGVYALYAVLIALLAFFSGGAASELYVLFFPLVLSAALHGSWRIALAALLPALGSYALVMLPDFVTGGAGADTPQTILFRLSALALAGVFVLFSARRSVGFAERGYVRDEDGSVLLERLADEMAGGERAAVVLVDPGREVEDVDLLLDRVHVRVGEPTLLGEGAVFGLVLGGMDESGVEAAARRALAAAGSLGARETRAGAAVYPHDARSPEDLLNAAGRALEAAFEKESPSAVVLAGKSTGGRRTGR